MDGYCKPCETITDSLIDDGIFCCSNCGTIKGLYDGELEVKKMDVVVAIRQLYDLLYTANSKDDFLDILFKLEDILDWRVNNGFMPTMTDYELIKTIRQAIKKSAQGLDYQPSIGG